MIILAVLAVSSTDSSTKCSPACAVKIFSCRNKPVCVQWHLLEQVAVLIDLWGTRGVSSSVLTQGLLGSSTSASLYLLGEAALSFPIWLQAPENSESEWEYRMFRCFWCLRLSSGMFHTFLGLTDSVCSSSPPPPPCTCIGWELGLPGFASWGWLNRKTYCAVRNKK